MRGTLIAILLLTSIGCESAKDRQGRIDAAQKRFDQAVTGSASELDQKLRDTEIELFGKRYGEQAAMDLLLCEHNPPELEKNKAKCRGLETRFEKWREYRKTHPTW